MDMLKEIERIEALAEKKRDSVKLVNFWKMYALEMRDEKNAEIQKLQTDLQNWKDFCKKVQRQHLAEQPNVDVLVETLRVANSALDTCKINIDHSELEQHSFEFDENAVFNAKLKIFAALATYQSKNEKE